MALAAEGTSEQLDGHAAYERLHIVAASLTIVVLVLFTALLGSPAFEPAPLYGLAGTLAVFALAWHCVLPRRLTAHIRLFTEDLFLVGFASLAVRYSGGAHSPLAFLYLLPLLLGGLAFGPQATLGIAAAATVGFLGAAVASAPDGSWASAPSAWATVGSLWTGAALVALLGLYLGRVLRQALDAKERAEQLSTIDPLTGLYNRRHLQNVLDQEIARSRRSGRSLALLIIDSDNALKQLNDTYGHLAGDRLLVDLAHTIRAQIRVVDTAGRYGGDEFVVLMPETDSAGATVPAERIRAAIADLPVPVGQASVHTTVSVGIASCPQDATDGEELLARADAALYASKKAGRNRVNTYQPDMARDPTSPR